MQLKKRGQVMQRIFWTMAEIILPILILLILLGYVNNVASGESFEKTFLAIDTALFVDTLYAAPGHVASPYITNPGYDRYNYEFSKNKVEIYKSSEEIEYGQDYMRGRYYFLEDNLVSFEHGNLTTPPTFTKTRTSISIGYSGLKDFYSKEKVPCPTIDTKANQKEKIILIDAGSEAYASDGVNASEVALNVGKLFKNRNERHFKAVNLTRQDITQNPPAAKRKEQAEQADLVISWHIGINEDKDKNEFIVYIASDSSKIIESRKLACLLINDLLDKFDMTKKRVLFVQPLLLDPDDPRQILPKDKPAVFVEFGNIENDDFAKKLDMVGIDTITKGIYNAIKKYYE